MVSVNEAFKPFWQLPPISPVDQTYSLQGLVAELCERAGMDYTMYDVSKLDGTVIGTLTNNDHPVFTHLRQLSDVFFFDPSSHGGKLNFVHRGGDSVAVIDRDDLLSDSDDQIKRRDGVLPREIHLEYFDLDGQLSPDIQTSDRSLYIRENSEDSIDTPVVLETDFAAKLATVIHKVMIEEQRGEIEFSLPDNYLALAVGDIIIYNNERMRIVSVDIDQGMQEYRCVFDRKSAYSSAITGIAPNVPGELNLVPGPTLMEFLDIPVLRSTQDELGYYFAISGASDAWKGAQVEVSFDDGISYPSSSIASDYNVIGELITAMPSHLAEVPDYHSVVQIEMTNPSAELTPASLTEMMNRINRAIIGDELVNFGGAVEVSEGVWELSTFLRGRLHTDATSHGIGERFVLLDGAENFVNTESYNIGETLTFRATSLGTSTQTTISGTFTGAMQIEPPPSNLRVHRVGANLIIEWFGTGVKGGKSIVEMSKYFIGYRVDVNASITDTTNETLTVTDPGGTVTITVQQLNSKTGAGQAATITI